MAKEKLFERPINCKGQIVSKLRVFKLLCFFSCYAGSWEESDLPEAVHSELFPQCPFVLGNGCGNRPMTEQQRQEVAAEIAISGNFCFLCWPIAKRSSPAKKKDIENYIEFLNID